MIEATSCGGVVIYRGKILTLYKSYKNKYDGWVLPKGTVEAGEEYKETALREVAEESGVHASIIKYVGKSQYSFSIPDDVVEKEVHWYLMMANSYYSKPQREEYFIDSGYYKFHEAYHLLKFSNERQILEIAYNEYLDLRKSNLWGNPFDIAAVVGNKTGKTIVHGHWHNSTGWAAKGIGSEFEDDACFDICGHDGCIGLDACTAWTHKVNVLVVEDNMI